MFSNDLSLSLSLSLTHWLTLSRASYELEMCRRDGVWAGNQYSARYMEVCNLITLSFSGLSLNRPNQTSQPELYFRYYPITSILRHTKANNITKGRYILMLSNYTSNAHFYWNIFLWYFKCATENCDFKMFVCTTCSRFVWVLINVASYFLTWTISHLQRVNSTDLSSAKYNLTFSLNFILVCHRKKIIQLAPF